MSDSETTIDTPTVLSHIARDLHDEFRGTFSEPTIFGLVRDTYKEFSRTASVTRWLALGAEVSVRRRLTALAANQSIPTGHKPSVLFVCEHDAAPSQIAAMWLEHLVGDQAEVWSTGPSPSPALAAAITAAMAEVGISISSKSPRATTEELTLAADAVVTVGRGDACLVMPGKHYEDWDLDAPSDPTLADIRVMRDQLRDLVTHLSHEVGVIAA